MNILFMTLLLGWAGFAQTPQSKTTKTTPEANIVESASLTSIEAQEGRELLITRVTKLRQRGELAQKVLDQLGNSSEALLLAYQERDRVLVELGELETKSKKYVSRVQTRTGCLDCELFDFDNLLLKKRPALPTK